jgi:5-amino-6-(5-phosphoribosylamino)uracil reductase
MPPWAERFEQLVEKKTKAALSQELPPYITAFDGAGPPLQPIGNSWTRTLFDGDFYISSPPAADLPAASLVFVQSRDGNTGASDPSTLGGGATDKHLVYEGLSRVAADAVLAGAETIRTGSLVLSVWHPELVALRKTLGLPRHPVQIVASLRGVTFDDGLMFNVPSIRVVVITVRECSAVMREGLSDRPWIETVMMNRPDDLPDAFRALRRMGINRISCIGGRRVAASLIDANLVQDLYLTTSPKSGGRGSGSEEGVVFEHFRLGD